MTETSQITADPNQNPNHRYRHHRRLPGLAVLAGNPATDPCDVACDAMPAHLLAELATEDEAWLRDHVAECGYCRRQLRGYAQLGPALDAVCAPPPMVEPPPIRLPRPRSAPPAAVPAWTRSVDSPVGPLVLAATADGLCEVAFARSRTPDEVRALLRERGLEPRAAEAPAVVAETLARARDQLAEYFAGRRDRFDLPLDFRGVTPFTRSVLEATAGVDFGRLETYRGIAGRIGKPGATRAVGNALGRNPLPVVVPCHRIVRSGGGIGGYTGGLDIKERLLAIEGVALSPSP